MEMWFIIYIDSDGTSKNVKVPGATITAAIQKFHELYPGLHGSAVRSCFSTRM